ncbi:MAG: GAF domain-containing protein, partial [Flavobacteriales bacterium]
MITTLDDELAIEKKKLNALLEITNSVNRNYQVEELLLQFEKVMRYHIGISKLAYINNCNNWDCILHFGVSDACSEFDRTEMLTITEPTLVSETSLKKFTQFDLVLPVFHQEKPLSYLFIGDIQLGLVQFIQKHIGFVQTIANVVSVAIETKMLSEELMEKRLKENDMKMAVYMQNVL